MTKRLKVYLLIVFAAACIACTFAGCKIGRPGRSELLAGYNTHVTYYSNGGYFNKSTSLKVRELYFKGGEDGVPFFDIAEDSDENTDGIVVEREFCDLIGWYLPATYPEGHAHAGEIIYQYTYTPDKDDPSKPADEFDVKNPNNVTVNVFPLYNERGGVLTDDETDRPVYARENVDEQILERDITIVCSDTKVNSGEKIEQNIDDPHGLIVCAKWVPAAEIEYHLVITNEKGEIINDGTEYEAEKDKETIKVKSDSILQSFPIAGDGEKPQADEPLKIEGLTFVRTFMDKELTQSLKYIPRPTEIGASNPVVYCRYIIGEWNVVRTADDVQTMFGSIATSTPKKFYVINDIDYGNTEPITARVATARAANAYIFCDKPHTITGLTVKVPSPLTGKSYSMLGKIGEQFSVSDLTLKDIKITIPASMSSFNFYAICAGADSAKVENINLTIENVTATYQGEPTIYNAIGDDRSHWLFDHSAASDEAFLAKFTGIKLTGNKPTLTKIPTEET